MASLGTKIQRPEKKERRDLKRKREVVELNIEILLTLEPPFIPLVTKADMLCKNHFLEYVLCVIVKIIEYLHLIEIFFAKYECRYPHPSSQ